MEEGRACVLCDDGLGFQSHDGILSKNAGSWQVRSCLLASGDYLLTLKKAAAVRRCFSYDNGAAGQPLYLEVEQRGAPPPGMTTAWYSPPGYAAPLRDVLVRKPAAAGVRNP
eukprot:5788238-Pyramimonas_sp.AAC.2